MSAELAGLVMRDCRAEDFKDCDLVFSGLDSDVAGDVGMMAAKLRKPGTMLIVLQKWSS